MKTVLWLFLPFLFVCSAALADPISGHYRGTTSGHGGQDVSFTVTHGGLIVDFRVGHRNVFTLNNGLTVNVYVIGRAFHYRKTVGFHSVHVRGHWHEHDHTIVTGVYEETKLDETAVHHWTAQRQY